LFTIARNELYAYLRRRPGAEHVDFDSISVAEIVTSASSRLDRARQIDRLRIAVTALPAEQQLLLELHYWHGLDASALGEVFATAPATIRVRLLRARQALRRHLADVDPSALATAANSHGDRLAQSLLERDES